MTKLRELRTIWILAFDSSVGMPTQTVPAYLLIDV